MKRRHFSSWCVGVVAVLAATCAFGRAALAADRKVEDKKPLDARTEREHVLDALRRTPHTPPPEAEKIKAGMKCIADALHEHGGKPSAPDCYANGCFVYTVYASEAHFSAAQSLMPLAVMKCWSGPIFASGAEKTPDGFKVAWLLYKHSEGGKP
jgi:hypothetical protein